MAAAWTQALDERCPLQDYVLNNWLAAQFGELDLPIVEAFAKEHAQALKGYPNLIYALAQRMRANQHWHEALKFLEETDAESEPLQRLWTELSLQLGDYDAAETHAHRVLNYHAPGGREWHELISQQLAQLRKPRR